MRRFLKWTVSLLILVALAAGGWLLWHRYGVDPGVPGEVLAAERALATTDVVMLASVDASAWGRLAAGPDLPRLAHALVDRLGVSGLPLAQATRRAVFALYPGDGPRLRAALVLFGEFEGVDVRAGLRAGRTLELPESVLSGQPVLWVSDSGVRGCDGESGWGVVVTPKRVVLARAEIMEALLSRLAGADVGGGRDLSGFAAFRGRQVLSVALFPPAEPAAPGVQPLLRSLLNTARSRLEGIEAVYLGIDAGLLGRSLDLEVALQAEDPTTAQHVVAAWRDLPGESAAELSRVTPLLGDLHQEAEQHPVRAGDRELGIVHPLILLGCRVRAVGIDLTDDCEFGVGQLLNLMIKRRRQQVVIETRNQGFRFAAAASHGGHVPAPACRSLCRASDCCN